MQLATNTGFVVPAPVSFTSPDHLVGNSNAVDLPNDADAARLAGAFGRITLIRIPFPNSTDGRGFSLARRLRDLGYTGRLRAAGHMISDQFRLALACGFDEVEIDDTLAARQPERDWLTGATAPAGYREKLAGRHNQSAFPAPDGVTAERVTEVQHYTGALFRFRTTRPQSFRFRSGEFAMIGLPNAAKPVFRAYSLAAPSWDGELEFYSIKVPGGPLTQHLQRIVPGDTILLKGKATGTLVLDALSPGRRLFLFSTGTGIAPFASLIRDPETYERFAEIVVTHTCRTNADLSYGRDVVRAAQDDPLVGELARARLRSYASTTRDKGRHVGRITERVGNGQIFDDLAIPPLNPQHDRVMICGSLAMVKEFKALLERMGFTEGANNRPSDFVVERAFVD